MRVLFLTKYSQLGASSRYRTYQYLKHLSSLGLDCEVSPLFPDIYLEKRYGGGALPVARVIKSYLLRFIKCLDVSRYDLLVIEKELFPYIPASIETVLLKMAAAYTLDFDDALFHIYDRHRNPLVRSLLGKKHASIMKKASLVTAGNPYIAEYSRNYAECVEVVPTVLDLEKYHPTPEPEGIFTVGWIGTPISAKYLHIISGSLRKFFEMRTGRLLLVGASRGFSLDGVPTEVVDWSKEEEAFLIQKMHIGIMPVPDKPLERGKSGLKILQYFACSRPVVTSPVGVNEMIVKSDTGFLARTEDDWLSSFLALADDPAQRRRMGRRGRAMVEESYNLKDWAVKYFSMLKTAGAQG